MLTLEKLNQREAEIKGFLQQTIARVEQMRGALECIALLKKDWEAADAERRAADQEAMEEAIAEAEAEQAQEMPYPAADEFKHYTGYETLTLSEAEHCNGKLPCDAEAPKSPAFHQSEIVN